MQHVQIHVIMMTDIDLNIAYVSINVLNGVFIPGELFYQFNGVSNYCTGTIFHSNSSVLFLENINGIPSNSYSFIGQTSSANCTANYVNTQIVCSNLSNNVVLPFTGNGSVSLFHANHSFCMVSNDVSHSEVAIVTHIYSDQKTLQLSWAPAFSDSYCSAHTLRGDNLSLFATWQGYDGVKFNSFTALLNDSTADTTIDPNFHFGESVGKH